MGNEAAVVANVVSNSNGVVVRCVLAAFQFPMLKWKSASRNAHLRVRCKPSQCAQQIDYKATAEREWQSV